MARRAASTSALRSAGWSSTALWVGLALIVLLADQVSKTLIVGSFQLGEIRKVTDYFNLVLALNSGAAFSLLADAGGWQRWFFTVLGIGASVAILWMIRTYPTQKLFCFSVSMILGGAIGNVTDRLLRGHVIDFLQFHFSWLQPVFPGGYFPSFNVADSAITLGAVCLVLDELLRVRRGAK